MRQTTSSLLVVMKEAGAFHDMKLPVGHGMNDNYNDRLDYRAIHLWISRPITVMM